MSIYGNVAGLPAPQSDWAQEDPSRGDYIRNKPDLSLLEQGMAQAQAMAAAALGEIPKARPYNILDNSDFKDPVVLDGFKTNPGSGGNPIARWYDRYGFGAFAQTEHGITVSYGTNHAYFNQTVENSERYVGKKMTLAFCDYDGNVYIASGLWNNTDSPLRCSIGSSAEFLFTLEGYVQFVCLSGSIGLQWAALYEGEYTAETLPRYQPKGKRVEQLNCGVLCFEITAAIPATAWYPVSSGYECFITVAGITATDTPIVDVYLQGDGADYVDGNIALCEEYAKIFRAMAFNGVVYFQATDMPAVEIPIKMKVVR